MNPETVLINFVIDTANADKAFKGLEDSLGKLKTLVTEVHKDWQDGIKATSTAIDTYTDKIVQFHDRVQVKADKMVQTVGDIGQRFSDVGRDFKKHGGLMLGSIDKLRAATKKWHTQWMLMGLLVGQGFVAAKEATDAIIANTGFMRLATGMTSQAIAEMNAGILKAANMTGESIEKIATQVRALYEATGLTKGLTDIAQAGLHMNRVFNASEESFNRMAGEAAKLSDGILTGSILMKAFDKSSGLAGQKMDDLLGKVTEINKELARINGNGKAFAKTSLAITKYLAEAAAQMQRLGGNADLLGDLTYSILDPERWDEIAQKMPGMAGNLYAMNQALANNDMTTFNRLMAEGAQKTLDMSRNMGTFARAATGWDIGAAERLSKIQFNGLEAGAGAAGQMGSVLERSKALMQNFQKSFDRFWNNVYSVFIKIFQPAFESIVEAFTKLNDVLSENQENGAIFIDVLSKIAWGLAQGVVLLLEFTAWFAKLAGTGGAVAIIVASVAANIIMLALGFKFFGLMFTKFFVAPVAKGVEKVGEAAAKVTTGFFGSLAEGLQKLGRTSADGMKGAAMLVAMGAAFALFGVGVYLIGQAPWYAAILGMTAFVIGIVALAAVMTFAAPILIPAVGLLLAFGAAIALFGVGMFLVAKAFEIVATSMGILGSGLITLAKGLVAFWAAPVYRAASGIYTIAGAFAALAVVGKPASGAMGGFTEMINMITNMAKNFAEILVTTKLITENAGAISTGFDLAFGPKGFMVKSIESIHKGLSVSWGFDKTISAEMTNSMKTVVDTMGSLANGLDQILTMSMMMTQKLGAGTVFTTLQHGMDSLFGENGVLTYATQLISKNVTKVSTDGINGIVTMLTNFTGVFEQLAVMGVMMSKTVGGGGTSIKGFMDTAIIMLFGPDGVFTNATNLLGKMKTKGVDDAVGVVQKQVGLLQSIMGAFDQLAVMSLMLASSVGGKPMKQTIGDALTFMFGTDGVLDKIQKGIQGKTFDASTEVTGAVSATLSNEAKMNIQGQAEVAFQDFRDHEMEHQQTVEDLLKGILNAIKTTATSHPQASEKKAQTHFNPEAFAFFGGGNEAF